MKQKLRLITVLFLTVVMTMFVAACGGSKLETPTNFEISDNYELSWSTVADARSYRVEVKDVAKGEIIVDASSRRTTHSLSGLEEGDYEIRVMAIGGSNNESRSSWSEVLNFHKNYESGMVYTLITNNTEYQVYRVGSASGEVVIEDEYRNKPVTEIAERAFRSAKIEGVTIGNRIRSIGNNAFANCTKMTYARIPDSVTYCGMNIFQNCIMLEDVNIPSGISYIPQYMFAYCRALEHIEIPENITEIDEGAFNNCTALKTIDIPDSVEYIGEKAFIRSSLETVNIGSGITEIDANAFEECTSLKHVNFAEIDHELTLGSNAFFACTALEEIELPEGVTSMGQNLFSQCTALEKVNVPSTVTSVAFGVIANTKLYRKQAEAENNNGFIYVGNWLASVKTEVKDVIETITPDDFREGTVGIASFAFSGDNYSTCRNLISVELPQSIKYLGEYAFRFCYSLTKFISSDYGLEVVGNSAFMYCPILNNVQFGIGLREIDNNAFKGCSQLNNNIFADTLVPETVERIGTGAFSGTALYETADEYGVIYAGKWAVGMKQEEDGLGGLLGSFASGPIVLKEGVLGIANYAFKGGTFSAIEGMSQVRHIGAGAFYQCSYLSRVTLNRNIRQIEKYTFYGCGSLFDVELPARCESIGERAFEFCARLTELDLSGTDIKTIGEHAFDQCGNLQTINFGDQLESIGDYCFFGCTELTEITLPDSMTELPSRAFTACTRLQSIDFGSGIASIGSFAFRGCVSLQNVVIPGNVKTVGQYAFYNCTSIENLVIEEGVERIEKYAFSGLENYRQLILPRSLKYIGDYGFKNGYSLQSLVLQGSIEFIGINAFYGNKLMTVYTDASQDNLNNWMGSWNSSRRPVLWECELSEDKSYVVSLTVGGITNPLAHGGISAPVREGYSFKGWATVSGGEPEYEAFELRYLEPGTTLYAVWEEVFPE